MQGGASGILLELDIFSQNQNDPPTDMEYEAAVRVFDSTGINIDNIARYATAIEERVVAFTTAGEEECAAEMQQAYYAILKHNTAQRQAAGPSSWTDKEQGDKGEGEVGELSDPSVHSICSALSEPGDTIDDPLPRFFKQLASLTNVQFQKLANFARKENWGASNSILKKYMEHTYEFLVIMERHKLWEFSCDGRQYLAFHTGLYDAYLEPLYAVFLQKEAWHQPASPSEMVRQQHARPFELVGWFGVLDMCERFRVPNRLLPQQANYLVAAVNASDFYYDPSITELHVNWEHIIDDIKANDIRRLDACPVLKDLPSNDARVTMLKGALDTARAMVRESFRTAVPQYFVRDKHSRRGEIQLLLPLFLNGFDQRPDLVLAVSKMRCALDGTLGCEYLGRTVLDLDSAYNNARQLCRIESEWLRPDCPRVAEGPSQPGSVQEGPPHARNVDSCNAMDLSVLRAECLPGSDSGRPLAARERCTWREFCMYLSFDVKQHRCTQYHTEAEFALCMETPDKRTPFQVCKYISCTNVDKKKCKSPCTFKHPEDDHFCMICATAPCTDPDQHRERETLSLGARKTKELFDQGYLIRRTAK